MEGLILNWSDDRLPPGSPWRTRFETRRQPPVFVLDDGLPVYEVWFWCGEHERWFVMSRSYREELAAAGCVVFYGIEQLKAWMAYLGEAKAQQGA